MDTPQTILLNARTRAAYLLRETGLGSRQLSARAGLRPTWLYDALGPWRDRSPTAATLALLARVLYCPPWELARPGMDPASIPVPIELAKMQNEKST